MRPPRVWPKGRFKVEELPPRNKFLLVGMGPGVAAPRVAEGAFQSREIATPEYHRRLEPFFGQTKTPPGHRSDSPLLRNWLQAAVIFPPKTWRRGKIFSVGGSRLGPIQTRRNIFRGRNFLAQPTLNIFHGGRCDIARAASLDIFCGPRAPGIYSF